MSRRAIVATERALPLLAPALLAFALIVVTARAGGGYAASTWGWIALGPIVVLAAVFALADRFEGGVADFAFVGLLSALLSWTAMSAIWSDSVPRTVSEVQRDLVYVAASVALLAVTSRQSAVAIPGAVLTAVTAVCVYALCTRLAPDRFGLDLANGYRLSRPIGYWNGLGLIAAMAIVLALGVAAFARRAAARALGAATVVVLVATLYFTFSRGAWIALGAGVAVALAVEPRRSRLAAVIALVTPLLAATVWLCWRAGGLNDAQAARQSAAHDGERLAFALLAVSLACALVPVGLERLGRDVRLSRAASRGLAPLLAASFLAVSVIGLIRIGGPQALWERSVDAFRASPWPPESSLHGRLLTVSGHSRSDYWRVAWSQASSHPLLGSGAGTYDLYWARDRPVAVGALDAHNIYLETLAELGPLGLVLLAGLLGTPIVALRRARQRSGVGAAGGAYAAYLLAIAVDWHWELPTVTIVAFCCGVAVLVAARGSPASHRLGRGARITALAAVAAGAAFALVIQLGNGSVTVSARDTAAGNYATAEVAARRATRWAPWSPAGWVSLERAQRARGEIGPARASLRRALALDPRDWRLWYELTLVSTGTERRDAAARMRRLNPYALATVDAG